MEEDKTNLRGLLEKIAKEQGYDDHNIILKPISTGGANYSSALYSATISAPNKEDLKLFAKVATASEKLRSDYDFGKKSYDTERLFYTELVNTFKHLYDKHGVTEKDRLNISKYYGNKDTPYEETIVLEDLAASGYESFDRFKTFDWDYASSAATQLAKFHALGIACKEEKLKELDKIKEIGMTDYFSAGDTKRMLVQHVYKMGTEVIKEEYRDRMKKFLDNNDIYGGMDTFWKSNGNLIFGDFRPSNLMHRKKDGKVQIMPLDYQTIHFGTMAADLMYLIWSGSDAEFRKNHYKEMLELYYKELTEALRNLHVDIAKVYPRKVFEQELEETKTIGLCLGLMMSILTVEPENAPTLNEMSDMFIMPNQLGLQRMNEVVEDYARSGII